MEAGHHGVALRHIVYREDAVKPVRCAKTARAQDAPRAQLFFTWWKSSLRAI
jgi:hypothetical protein